MCSVLLDSYELVAISDSQKDDEINKYKDQL